MQKLKMKFFLLLLIITINIHFITSNIICRSPAYSKKNTNRVDDEIDIQFSSQLSTVNGITFNAVLNINVTNAVLNITETNSYLQENVKSLDFELLYRDNGTQKSQLCNYDIPPTGNVSHVLPINDLIFFTQYEIFVGYTLKSGDSFERKANTTFETCFGQPGKLEIL